jgi:hypothetical protein
MDFNGKEIDIICCKTWSYAEITQESDDTDWNDWKFEFLAGERNLLLLLLLFTYDAY